jgi:hypothetical protein
MAKLTWDEQVRAIQNPPEINGLCKYCLQQGTGAGHVSHRQQAEQELQAQKTKSGREV